MKSRYSKPSGLLLLAALAWARPVSAALPLGAENVDPLAVGSHAPAAVVKTPDSADLDLGQAFAAKPTVLIFYRGGWCPFCNRQLAGIQDYAPKFIELGYQILAVCTDKPEDLRATAIKDHLTYTVLSDRSMAAASAFKVAFRLTDQDAKRYVSNHIALPEIQGESGASWLVVPSIFIIGTDGIIKFVEFNPNYRIRPPPADILNAAARVKTAQ